MIKIFALLLINQLSFGQIQRDTTQPLADEFQSDSINKSPYVRFNNRIRLSQIDKIEGSMDIRLYKEGSLSNTVLLRRIYYDKGAWKAMEYNEWNNPKKIKKHKLKGIPNIDSVVVKLLLLNILTLPNQTELATQMREFTGELDDKGYPTYSVWRIADGTQYTVEIRVGRKFRVYFFANPDGYLKHYENIRELKNYVNIVNTFNNLLQWE